MADVFISYLKQDAEHAKALAADLEARGYTTWWDTSLLPGDQFPEEIKRQIDAAKAVIVIWTPDSVKSKWVRAEAARADAQGKLITIHTGDCDFSQIPMPFNTRQCGEVTNRDKLLLALVKLGLSPPMLLTSESKNVEFIDDRFDLHDEALKLRRMSNSKKAIAHATAVYRRGVELNAPDAVYVVAAFFEDQVGDQQKAFRLLKYTAEMNYELAMVDVGRRYMEGRGVSKDPVRALEWLQRAVDLGDEEGASELIDDWVRKGLISAG